MNLEKRMEKLEERLSWLKKKVEVFFSELEETCEEFDKFKADRDQQGKITNE